MNGLGFFIWQLANMPDPDTLATRLQAGGVKWVIFKVLDGTDLFNAQNNSQKLLKEYWTTLKAAGIEPGGYQYVYGAQPGPEGDQAAAFIEEFDPAHFTINAEGEYRRVGSTKAAKTYCAKLKVNRLEVLFCSYRFPSRHGGTPAFPFDAFFNAESVDTIAPQVYWLGARNPVQQLEQSIREHRQGTDYSPPCSKPILPIGSAFGQAIKRQDGSTYWWEATPDELRQFKDAALSVSSAVGFWSLDWIFTRNRQDYWEAITGVSIPPDPEPIPGEMRTVNVANLSVRSQPEYTPVTDPNGTLFARGINGRRVRVLGQAVNGYVPVEAWVWEKGLE